MASRFELYYGEPGSGKSRSLLALIKYHFEKTGKISRIYIGDGSASMYDAVTDAGMAKLMDFGIRDQPFTTCQQITEGFWPEDVENPTSKMVKLSPAEITGTGMWIFEGASVMGVHMMGSKPGALAYRAANGEVIGQDTNVSFQDSNEYKFAGNSPAHYNVAQRHLHANILRSKAFPGWVVWTAHERMDDGERGGAFGKGQAPDKVKLSEKIIGPELVGKALTSNISRDFGNTLHFTVAGKKVAGAADGVTGKTGYTETTDYRIYTRDHYDPDGIVGLKYRAVVRALNPEKVKDFYNGKPGEGLLKFYDDLAIANKL